LTIPKAEVVQPCKVVTIKWKTPFNLTQRAGLFEVKDETTSPLHLMGFTLLRKGLPKRGVGHTQGDL